MYFNIETCLHVTYTTVDDKLSTKGRNTSSNVVPDSLPKIIYGMTSIFATNHTSNE